MKVKQIEPDFEPIKLEITLETQQEAQEFYNVFNHSAIVDNTPNISHRTIRDIITRGRNASTIVNTFQLFADNLAIYYKWKFGL